MFRFQNPQLNILLALSEVNISTKHKFDSTVHTFSFCFHYHEAFYIFYSRFLTQYLY